MTHHDTHGHDDDQTEGAPGKPSQAEGERNPGAQNDQTQSPGGKPSQAEGERETVEEDLNRS